MVLGRALLSVRSRRHLTRGTMPGPAGLVRVDESALRSTERILDRARQAADFKCLIAGKIRFRLVLVTAAVLTQALGWDWNVYSRDSWPRCDGQGTLRVRPAVIKS